MQRWACVSALTDALQRLSVHGAMRLQGMFSFQGIQKQARWKFWSLCTIEIGRDCAEGFLVRSERGFVAHCCVWTI